MSSKTDLINILEASQDKFVSGNDIAEKLGITRAGVWKIIKQLKDQGFEIEAVRNRGYRLGPDNDVVRAEGINKYLGDKAGLFQTEVFLQVTSTNDLLKEKAASVQGYHTIIANHQTSGKGRRAREFFSPPDTGVYISMIIKMDISARSAVRITTAAALAACMAIEECTDRRPEIKWVNDVFIDGKKVCGILTEASISMESQILEWAIMGIGFNVYEPLVGFPDELQNIAGFISSKKQKGLRSRLAASFMIHFYELCKELDSESLNEEYKRRSFILGKDIDVLKAEGVISAEAIDIDNEYRLIVRYKDGSKEALSSGEVSIRT